MSIPGFGRIYAVTATETRKKQSGSDGRRNEVIDFRYGNSRFRNINTC